LSNTTHLLHTFAIKRFALAIFLLACPQLHAKDVAAVKPESVGMSSVKLAEIAASTQALVTSKGKVVDSHACGLRDVDSGKPMQRETIFRIYSMSKAITTTTTMQRFEQGQIYDAFEK
jgi:CubicO group peptidase (beta-lactamase class C family)